MFEDFSPWEFQRIKENRVREKLLTAHGQACALALLDPAYPTPEQIVEAKKIGLQIEQTLKAALALL